MPKTINKEMFNRSRDISFTKKAGSFIKSEGDLKDSMKLAAELGVDYSGRDNLDDVINRRLASLGISLEFSEPVERLSDATLSFGQAATPASLANQTGFDLRDEIGERTVKTLNAINQQKITSIVNSSQIGNRRNRRRTDQEELIQTDSPRKTNKDRL